MLVASHSAEAAAALGSLAESTGVTGAAAIVAVVAAVQLGNYATTREELIHYFQADGSEERALQEIEPVQPEFKEIVVPGFKHDFYHSRYEDALKSSAAGGLVLRVQGRSTVLFRQNVELVQISHFFIKAKYSFTPLCINPLVLEFGYPFQDVQSLPFSTDIEIQNNVHIFVRRTVPTVESNIEKFWYVTLSCSRELDTSNITELIRKIYECVGGAFSCTFTGFKSICVWLRSKSDMQATQSVTKTLTDLETGAFTVGRHGGPVDPEKLCDPEGTFPDHHCGSCQRFCTCFSRCPAKRRKVSS